MRVHSEREEMTDDRDKNLVSKYYERVCEHRRYLHAHPELACHEEESAAYIAQALCEMGLEPQERVGGYGVTAVINGTKGTGKCVELRVDMICMQLCCWVPDMCLMR